MEEHQICRATCRESSMGETSSAVAGNEASGWKLWIEMCTERSQWAEPNGSWKWVTGWSGYQSVVSGMTTGDGGDELTFQPRRNPHTDICRWERRLSLLGCICPGEGSQEPFSQATCCCMDLRRSIRIWQQGLHSTRFITFL